MIAEEQVTEQTVDPAEAQARAAVDAMLGGGQQQQAAADPAAAAQPAPGGEDPAAQQAAQQAAALAEQEAAAAGQQPAGGDPAAAAAQQAAVNPATLEAILNGEIPVAPEVLERLQIANRIDPKSLQLVELYQSNPQNIRQALRLAATDFDSMNEKDVFKSMFRDQYPEFADDDDAFEEYLSKEIPSYDPDRPELTSSKLGQIEISKKISDWKKEMNGKKGDISSFLEKDNAPAGPAGPSPEQIEAEKARRLSELGDFKSLKIQLADGVEVGQDVSEDDLMFLKSAVMNPNAVFEQLYTKDIGEGKKAFDARKFAEDMAMLRNIKTLVLKGAEMGMNAQNDDAIKKMNVALGKTPMKSPASASSEDPGTETEEDFHRKQVQALLKAGVRG
jgi:hypothetical protein